MKKKEDDDEDEDDDETSKIGFRFKIENNQEKTITI